MVEANEHWRIQSQVFAAGHVALSRVNSKTKSDFRMVYPVLVGSSCSALAFRTSKPHLAHFCPKDQQSSKDLRTDAPTAPTDSRFLAHEELTDGICVLLIDRKPKTLKEILPGEAQLEKGSKSRKSEQSTRMSAREKRELSLCISGLSFPLRYKALNIMTVEQQGCSEGRIALSPIQK